MSDGSGAFSPSGVEFVDYRDESRIEDVMNLVYEDLSEPYSSKPSSGP